MRLLGLDLGGRQIRNALAQQDFNGADLYGGAQSRPRSDTVRDNRVAYEVHEGRMQTGRGTAYAGSRLKLSSIQKGTARKASLPAVLGKTRRTE
jgi:hypothetical protein